MIYFNVRLKNSFISNEQIDIGNFFVNKSNTPVIFENSKHTLFDNCRFDCCSFYVSKVGILTFKECEFVDCVFRSDDRKRFVLQKCKLIGSELKEVCDGQFNT